MESSADRWAIWIDTGGTFTDCIAVPPVGSVRRLKVLSSGAVRGRVSRRLSECELELDLPWSLPQDFLRGWKIEPLSGGAGCAVVRQRGARIELTEAVGWAVGAEVELHAGEEAAVLAARLATGTPVGAELPPMDLRLATTRGTNALLERRGAEVALFLTRGFADLIEIGNQQRPDLFALEIVKPPPLYAEVIEVEERLAADGSVHRALDDLDSLAATVEPLLERGIRTAAVSLLHSYRNPDHEQRLGAFLVEAGFQHVSISSELAPLIRYLPRAETAVVDAYLAPVIGDYVRRIRDQLGVVDPRLMTSAGGLVAASRFRPKDSLLSGPAGGVVGAAVAGDRSGYERVIAFDMGGTSTDVSRFDGEFDYRYETRVGAARLMAPALAIETVAAGGGSICSFDGFQLKVGPESAGADPGPACYGAGGPLTVTDVNLLLGRLLPKRFGIPVAPEAAKERALALLEEVRAAGDAALELEGLLAGFQQIANERMAEAVRRISVREGYDPSEYALVAFGGAGGQHGCALARLLGIGRVLVPRDASLLSAVGLGHAAVERFGERQVLDLLERTEDRLETWFGELAEEALEALEAEGIGGGHVRLRRVHLRQLGQDSTLAVDYAPERDLRAAFAEAFREVYGYSPEGRPIEVESLRVVAGMQMAKPLEGDGDELPESAPSSPSETVEAHFASEWRPTTILERSRLTANRSWPGPALVVESHCTTVVEPGWSVALDGAGALLLTEADSG